MPGLRGRLRQGLAQTRLEATSPGKTPRQRLRTTPFGAAISVQRATDAPKNHTGARPRARRGGVPGGKRAFEKPILSVRLSHPDSQSTRRCEMGAPRSELIPLALR